MGLNYIKIFKLKFTPFSYNDGNLEEKIQGFLNFWHKHDNIGKWAKENNIRIESRKTINNDTGDIELDFYIILSPKEYEDYRFELFINLLAEDYNDIKQFKTANFNRP